MSPDPVAGVDLVFVQKDSFLIEKAYSEFNKVGFLTNVGCTLIGYGLSECGATCPS